MIPRNRRNGFDRSRGDVLAPLNRVRVLKFKTKVFHGEIIGFDGNLSHCCRQALKEDWQVLINPDLIRLLQDPDFLELFSESYREE